MIKIYNRKTKEYETENVAGGRLLDLLYTSGAGRLGLELLVRRKIYSALTGFFCDSAFSRRSIAGFAKSFSIDLEECEKKLQAYTSFNDFFARKLKSDARSFDRPQEELLSPGDGRLQAWEKIDCHNIIQIKGMSYSLSELLQSEELAKEFQGGTYMILRLCPVDYHRFHFFDSGVCSESRRVKGEYYSVNPVALRKIPELFCRNKREYSIFSTDNFGEVLYVEVGATSVGSIIQTYIPGSRVKRGDEKGYFKFGGSTVLLFFKKDRIIIDKDITEQTNEGFETRISAGEAIGRSCILQ
ncbi:phosphatidylserine decarboxylase [Ruminiclostridium sufflavum DSM 19573]|uniref:Phosphatidylserine decarboxylase proenzyme n=1 Tax=Ruminiclostridium sufflavum DSM 19573 TaxID=1121337 RepID=A0A318XNS6_9FIRM|nr:phosphatidylserine decarboxylase [Ruminiclostridium sufflavum]PYG87244.1 phosphatidylserine decarboxylase [Ruminiclostridium sufflavum DSM 19573]